ncbi:MAG: HDIG domain-containing protein [Deltaproteobacteria bacterium]|jgi:putative nucleotidyltransferase with HDIG domain|nr:HDIG domain-containing protein [Deltaproteobacteria bacterium]
MTKIKTALPGGRSSSLSRITDFFRRSRIWTGLLGLGLTLTALSFLCTYEWGKTQHIYEPGDIADADIASPIAFSFNDESATEAKRAEVRKAQPLVCVLNTEPITRLRGKIEGLFANTGITGDPNQLENMRQAISEELGEELSVRMFNTLRGQATQTLILGNLLPWIEHRLAEGIVANGSILADYPGGVVIQNADRQIVASRSVVSDIAELRADLKTHAQQFSSSKLTTSLVLALLGNYLAPTLTPDFESTAKNADEAVKTLRPVILQIMAGEVIVRQGERVRPEHMPTLLALWSTEQVKFNAVRFLGILLGAVILCGGLFFTPNGGTMTKIDSKDLLCIGFIVTFFTVLAKAFSLLGVTVAASSGSFTQGAQVFAVPVAGATLMIIAFSSRRYFITSMLLAMFCTLAGKGQLPLFIFYFLSALFGSWITHKAQSRKDVVKTLPALLCALIPLWLAATMAQGGEAGRVYSEFPALMLGGFLSLLLTFALPPLIEILFGFTTRFSLMDLMNQEHPVLRQLMFDAPGTYHHCLIVGNMAELAAKAIDANSLLCKVGALYHDIGKIDKPQYFIENQFRGENPHDKISPTMSALVLTSHVKYGVELAAQARMGREIIDIIREHHGNSLIQYFYQKALAADIPAQRSDFCYEGPRPSTIESAIIMLADVVEASSRTLDNPTPSRIRTHVQRMIRAVLADGQMNNVDMTFKNLEQVEDSFTLILTGMFHKRIEYPGKQGNKAATGNAPAATAPDSAPAAENGAEDGQTPPAPPKTQLPLRLPAQPMIFDPEAEKQVRRQKEQEQSRLRDDDYHAAKWLGLEDRPDETTLLNKNPASSDGVNGGEAKKREQQEADKKKLPPCG